MSYNPNITNWDILEVSLIRLKILRNYSVMPVKSAAANAIIASSTYQSDGGRAVYETAYNSVANNINRTRVAIAKVTSPEIIRGESIGEGTITEIYADETRRPLLSPQNSILALKSTFWPPHNDSSKMAMQV